MTLTKVTADPWCVSALYDMLAERKPEESISHKRMPTMEHHRAFVASRPYLVWFLIYVDTTPEDQALVGNIYLTTHREVGIHIRKDYRGNGHGSEALKLLRDLHPGPILANINPANKGSIYFFIKHGAAHIQSTYRID